MKNFFISGLPRSRTAWLANFMTYGTSFCWHDALTFAEGPDGLWEHFCKSKQMGLDYLGDSDSALILHTHVLRKLFPEAPWVLIVRDVDDARESYWERFSGSGYSGGPMSQEDAKERFGKLDDLLTKAIRTLPNLLIVQFKELSFEATITKIWHHCIPDVQFNRQRWKMLETLQINIMANKIDFGTLQPI